MTGRGAGVAACRAAGLSRCEAPGVAAAPLGRGGVEARVRSLRKCSGCAPKIRGARALPLPSPGLLVS